MTFDVLFVCTGNVCRSPVAERFLRTRLAAGSGVRATSAGMGALVGAPIDDGSAAALRQLGIDPDGHRARQFQPWMALDADLVLTAEHHHADQVMREVPQAFRRVFTLKEFARLAGHIGRVGRIAASDDPRQAVAAAGALRGQVERPESGADDIADPYRRAATAAADAAGEIVAAVRTAVGFLGLPTVADPAAPRRRPMPFPR